MEHSFDIDLAVEYGVDGAIVIRHFVYWILKHKADDEKSGCKSHTHRDKTWTYCSVKRLTEIWPYWSVKNIKIILAKLIQQGVLTKDRFPGGCTTTNWYAFVDQARFLEMGRPSRNEKRGKDPPDELARKGQVVGPNGPTKSPKGPTTITTPIPTLSLGLKNNCADLLALDLKIAEKRKFLTAEISRIFSPNHREAATFAHIAAHLVAMVQTGRADISIFNDAVEWARSAKASRVANKKGLFVAKIKEKTGFAAGKRLLQKGCRPC